MIRPDVGAKMARAVGAETVPESGRHRSISPGAGNAQHFSVEPETTPALAAAKTLVEIDDLGALLKPEIEGQIGSLAAAERYRLLDVVGDAGALPRRVEDDAYRELPFAEDRLIGAGCRHEILEVYRIALCRRATFTNHDDVKHHAHCVAAVFAFELGLAQQPVECNIVGAPLLSRAEYRGVGERPQNDCARTGLGSRF